MEDMDLKNMVYSFRVQELHTFLSFAGINKIGRKSELQERVMEVLKTSSLPHRLKIHDLYQKLCQTSSSNIPDVLPPPSSPVHVNKYPVHPDITFVSLPFYNILGELLKPSSLNSHFETIQKTSFKFHLTPQQAMNIAAASSTVDYATQVQIRFCLLETSRPQDDCFPTNIRLKVNGRVCALPSLIPNNKPGMLVKRQNGPVNITDFLFLNPNVPNNIQVVWNSEYENGYVIACYLVRKLASSDLLQKLRAKGVRHSAITVGTIKEKLRGDADCELANATLRVSLLCPLGKSRMITPCKASTCLHLQCFDAALYLQMNEKKSTWICPVCQQPALYENLQIDGYFQEVLASSLLPPDCNEIVLNEFGSWSKETKEQIQPTPDTSKASILDLDDDIVVLDVVKPVKKLASFHTKKVSVIDLTCSDDDSETLDQGSPSHDLSKRPKIVTYTNPDSTTEEQESAIYMNSDLSRDAEATAANSPLSATQLKTPPCTSSYQSIAESAYVTLDESVSLSSFSSTQPHTSPDSPHQISSPSSSSSYSSSNQDY